MRACVRACVRLCDLFGKQRFLSRDGIARHPYRWLLLRIGDPRRLRSQNPGVRGECDSSLDAVSSRQPGFPVLRNVGCSWERRSVWSDDGPSVGPRQYRCLWRKSWQRDPVRRERGRRFRFYAPPFASIKVHTFSPCHFTLFCLFLCLPLPCLLLSTLLRDRRLEITPSTNSRLYRCGRASVAAGRYTS